MGFGELPERLSQRITDEMFSAIHQSLELKGSLLDMLVQFVVTTGASVTVVMPAVCINLMIFLKCNGGVQELNYDPTPSGQDA